MKIFVLLAAVAALAGCMDSETAPDQTAARYALPTGDGVYEFRLKDGTRCVTHTRGGVDCDWGRK